MLSLAAATFIMRKKEREKEKHVPNIAKAFLGQGHAHYFGRAYQDKKFKRCRNPETCHVTTVVHDILVYVRTWQALFVRKKR